MSYWLRTGAKLSRHPPYLNRTEAFTQQNMDSSEERVAVLDGKRHDPEEYVDDADRRPSAIVAAGEIVNASGHRDQLKRQYGLLSICGLALTIDNAWVALAGSIAISISQ